MDAIYIFAKKEVIVCFLSVCTALLLTACSKEAAPGENLTPSDGILSEDRGSSEKEENSASQISKEQEWTYVPELVTINDDRADYGKNSQPGRTS